MKTTLISLLVATSLLSACGDKERREFLYKPAYCLAGGLADLGDKDCLPQALKEKAEAVADAKEKSAVAEVPSEEMRVYYTDAQRSGMSYQIARELFTPNEKLTRSSTTMSLEAANLIHPAPYSKKCDADKARKEAITYVQNLATEHLINRETAKFLSENYTDLQLTELYRAAKANKPLADVSSDAFILPDPKRPGKMINVKPKTGTDLGGILSYTTSRVTSRLTDEHKAHIESILKERTALHRAKAAETDPSCADVTAPAAAPEVKEETP